MIKTIKFAGKERPVKYGFNALALYSEKEERGLSSIGEDMTIPEMLSFVEVGLMEGARVAGDKYDLTREQIADALDEDIGALEKFFDIFTRQMPKAKRVETGGK